MWVHWERFETAILSHLRYAFSLFFIFSNARTGASVCLCVCVCFVRESHKILSLSRSCGLHWEKISLSKPRPTNITGFDFFFWFVCFIFCFAFSFWGPCVCSKHSISKRRRPFAFFMKERNCEKAREICPINQEYIIDPFIHVCLTNAVMLSWKSNSWLHFIVEFLLSLSLSLSLALCVCVCCVYVRAALCLSPPSSLSLCLSLSRACV